MYHILQLSGLLLLMDGTKSARIFETKHIFKPNAFKVKNTVCAETPCNKVFSAANAIDVV